MEPRLEARLLFPWRLLAVVPRQHALARGRTVDIARLAREPVLTLPAGFGTRALFDAGCEMIGARPLIRMEAAGAQTLVAAAKAGYGVAIVPSLLIMDRLAIAWDGGRSHPPYLAGLADVLATALARIFPGHEYGFAPPIKAPEASRKPARAS
jgi:DNA-binding transcriptional LysR family regulator